MANTIFFSPPHTPMSSHKKISVLSNAVCMHGYRFPRRNPLSYVRSAMRANCSCRALKDNSPEINANVILQTRIRDYHMRFDDIEEEEEDDGKSHFYKDFAAYLSRVWMQNSLAEKYYNKAMEIQPFNRRLLREFAEFACDELGNPSKATEIYEKALQEHPEDVKLLGSYAFFLWKVDASK